MKEEGGREDESEAPPTKSRSDKSGPSFGITSPDAFTHGARLHMPGLGSDWLREEAWLFPAFLRHGNQSPNQ